MVAGHAMLAQMDLPIDEAYKKMNDDSTSVAGNFISAATGCMTVFVRRHLDLKIEDGVTIKIMVPNLLSITLPFFTGAPGQTGN
jgi:hypothetical protein